MGISSFFVTDNPTIARQLTAIEIDDRADWTCQDDIFAFTGAAQSI